MSTEILMPALSPTMTEGNLTKWLVKEGQEIKAGDVIAEIETDKATMEVESVDEGFIEKLLYKEGDINIPVNKPIALISEVQISIIKKQDTSIVEEGKKEIKKIKNKFQKQASIKEKEQILVILRELK